MKENEVENKITECVCPVCNSSNCKLETTNDPNEESRVCENCGFMTIAAFKIGSPFVEMHEQTAAKIVVALKYEDKVLNQYWYPSTLFINSKGAIFPVGNEAEWHYAYAPVVPIPIAERLQYPVQGKTDEYYEMRLALDHTKTCENFKAAVDLLMK